MSDGKLSVLHQRHRCVYRGRQLGRSGVTSTALHGKENSVRHQIRFHSVVGASLHQRNLAVYHRRRLMQATDFFQAAGFTVKSGVSVMATFSLLAARVRSSWLQLHRLIAAAWTADVEKRLAALTGCVEKR